MNENGSALIRDGLVATIDRLSFHYGDEVAIKIVHEQAALGVEEVGLTEICENSKAVAIQLYSRFGVRRGDTVLIVCPDECAAAQITAIISCARIGAIFCPVDVRTLRTLRSDFILRDTKAVVAITVAKNDTDYVIQALSSDGIFKVVYLQYNGELFHQRSMDVAEDYLHKEYKANSSDSFYVLYTSGSTGPQPKGVVGTETWLLHRIAWQWEKFPFQSREEICCKRTPLVFVDSLAELFAPLLAGVSLLALRSKESLMDIVELSIMAAKHGVSRITMLPSQLQLLLSSPIFKWQSLKFVMVSGEPLYHNTAKSFHFMFPHVRLINIYGSTEIGGDITFYEVTPSREIASINQIVSIGEPIRNATVWIVDIESIEKKCFQEVEDSQEGELVVGGMCLSNGYTQEADDAARFIEIETAQGALTKIFRTGDRAMRKFGTLFYLGRIDNLTKINGVRVSLEEIEANVASVTAMNTNDVKAVLSSRGKLVLFLRTSIKMKEASQRFLYRLPKSQRPHLLRFIKEFPRTDTGKVDSRALRNMIFPRNGSISKQLAEEFICDVLNVDTLDPERSLPENGADSALLISFKWQLKQNFNLNYSINELENMKVERLMKEMNKDSMLKKRKQHFPVEDLIMKRSFSSKQSISVLWETKLSRCVDAKPCVVEELQSVFIGSHGGDFHRLNLATGVSIWSLNFNTRIEAGATYYEQCIFIPTYSAADVEGIETRMPNGDRNRGRMIALNAKTSEILWEFSCPGELKGASLVVENLLLFGAYDQTMYALDLQAGKLVFSIPLNGNVSAEPLRINHTDVLFATTSGTMEIVSLQKKRKKLVLQSSEKAPIFSSPKLDRSRSFLLVGAVNGCLQCYDTGTYSLIWKFQCKKALFNSPIVHEDIVIFGGHDGIIRSVSLKKGDLLWSVNLGAAMYASPVLLNLNNVVVFTTTGLICSVSISDREKLESLELPGEIFSSGMVINESSIVIGCRDNKVRRVIIRG